MNTYSIHRPMSSRRPNESSIALRTSTVVVIAVCVLIVLVALAFLGAAPVTSTHVKHLGHGAVISATGDKAAAQTTVVAANGAAQVAAAKAPVRPWSETLRGRALILNRSAAPVGAEQ